MIEPLIVVDPDDDQVPLPWQEEALCAQTDPEAFFPREGWVDQGGQAGVWSLRSARRVSVLRAGARRAVRHLGRAVRAGAPAAQATRGLTDLRGFAGSIGGSGGVT